MKKLNARARVYARPRALEGPSRPHLNRNLGAQVEGSPLPLDSTWIEDEQAFNFGVDAEYSESVTLLLDPRACSLFRTYCKTKDSSRSLLQYSPAEPTLRRIISTNSAGR